MADRLNHLFSTVPRPDRAGDWTNEQAAAELASRARPCLTATSASCEGKKNNPSARNLAAIAALFGVPVDYFFNRTQLRRLTPTCAYSLLSGMSGFRE